MDEVRDAVARRARRRSPAPVPWPPGTQPMTPTTVELVLNNTWRPTLSVTGAAGLPDPAARATCCGR